MCQIFYVLRNELSVGYDKRHRLFQYTHCTCKNRPLWQRHVYRHEIAIWAIFTVGFSGGVFKFLSDPTKSFVPAFIKNVDAGKFHIEIAKSITINDKKRLTNLY